MRKLFTFLFALLVANTMVSGFSGNCSGIWAYPISAFLCQIPPTMNIVILAWLSLTAIYLALLSGCNEMIPRPCADEIIKAIVNKWIRK